MAASTAELHGPMYRMLTVKGLTRAQRPARTLASQFFPWRGTVLPTIVPLDIGTVSGPPRLLMSKQIRLGRACMCALTIVSTRLRFLVRLKLRRDVRGRRQP